MDSVCESFESELFVGAASCWAVQSDEDEDVRFVKSRKDKALEAIERAVRHD